VLKLNTLIAPGTLYLMLTISTPEVKGHGLQGPKCKHFETLLGAPFKAATVLKLNTLIAPGNLYVLLTISTPEIKGHGPQGPTYTILQTLLAAKLKGSHCPNLVNALPLGSLVYIGKICSRRSKVKQLQA
jgi:hypothetical protein